MQVVVAEAEAVSGKASQSDSMEAWDAFRLAIAAETGRPIDDPFVMSAAHAMQAICSGLVNTLEHGWGDGRLYIERHQLVGSAFAPLVKHRWGP